MTEQQEISRVVTAVFRAWREANLDFLVLRNYERLPDFTTNDIDVLVGAADRPRAEATLLAAAREAGFRLHNRAEFATLALYLSSSKSTAQTHFDLFTALKWRGFDFLEARGFLARKVDRGLFAIPHPADGAATNLLATMIYTGRVKEKYRESIALGFRTEPAAARDLLARTYGAAHGKFLIEAGAQAKWAEIEARTGALRKVLICRQVTRQPWRTAKSFFGDIGRLARRLALPPGLTVVLCGADGSGKSTAAQALVEGLAGTFSPLKGRHYHWKPPVCSGQRRVARGPATDPHGKPPRNAALSLLYFGYHWLGFLLGSQLGARPITFRGGLVLIDRFYYDFFVDQRRYRLQVPLWVVRAGLHFLKQPDLVVLLDAPSDVLQSRKQEVSRAETERQRQAYREMVRGLKHGRVVDAAQPPEKVAGDIVRAALDFLAQRAATRS